MREADKEMPTFREWADEYLERVRLQKKRPELDEMYLGRAMTQVASTASGSDQNP